VFPPEETRPGECRTATNAAGWPSTSPTKQRLPCARWNSDSDDGRRRARVTCWPGVCEVESPASLKQPPGELARGHVVLPVRLQPVLDIVMAGDRDEPATGGSHAFRHGGAAHFCNRAINNRGELIDDRDVGLFRQSPSQVGAELFAGCGADEQSCGTRSAASGVVASAIIRMPQHRWMPIRGTNSDGGADAMSAKAIGAGVPE